MRILLAGLPGSGKTTQAELLARELNLCLVRTGDMLRQMSNEDSEVGRKLKEDLEKGLLVDNEVVALAVKKKVAEESCKNGFVMDGYPRSVDQTKYFDPEFDLVIFLRISEKEAVKRLALRGRSDDTPEAIRKRLEIQEENMLEVLAYYKGKCKVYEINGEKQEEAVHAEIRGCLS